MIRGYASSAVAILVIGIGSSGVDPGSRRSSARGSSRSLVVAGRELPATVIRGNVTRLGLHPIPIDKTLKVDARPGERRERR